jgi:purine nucleoside permease
MRLRLALLALLAVFVPVARAQKPWPIRAVIVTTFEIGNDTGDIPGEFQLWVEREHLDEVVPLPGVRHPLRTNKEHTVLGMVSGTTLVNATASMMALGFDPRFDLTHAYFLINGVAGVDPAQASIGSAAWARFVVGDVTREIDPHDAPADWPYGMFPLGATAPNPAVAPEHPVQRSNLYPLNAKLAEWAFAQTKDLKLMDDPRVAAFRAEFTGFPNAQRPPFVLLGDTFASDYYWHGATMTRYGEDWVRLWTGGRGVFVMTEMEDSGFLEALGRLESMHRVDMRRVMVLRTGSNFCMPRPGHTAIESVTAPYIGGKVAVESAWLTGSTVLHWLLAHWDTTGAHVPGEGAWGFSPTVRPQSERPLGPGLKSPGLKPLLANNLLQRPEGRCSLPTCPI